MCTAITYNTNNFYFGRNLDLEYTYDETINITPREYPLSFNDGSSFDKHYAMIGVAYVVKNYPLYYDAGNEYGLCMAGLSFRGNAVYNEKIEGKKNISPYEFIPWVLCQCKNLKEAKKLIETLNLINTPFSYELLLTDMHWMISDSSGTLVVEQTADGLNIYENKIGVLTNNPPFLYHVNNLNNYMMLSNSDPSDNFSDKLDLCTYSHGMGAIGLPGDLSSMSRFVRAAFVKFNSVSDGNTESDVCQFFHILDSVKQQKGCTKVGDKYEITVYSSCYDTKNKIYYYKTYSNSRICAVRMREEDINGNELINYTMEINPFVNFQN